MTNKPGADTTGATFIKSDLADELAALPSMDGDELRQRWRDLTGLDVPKVRAPLLRMALAWELQASARGGLSRSIRRDLIQAANGKDIAVKLVPGTKLVREWKGVLHTATVCEDGGILWDGRQWNSTSAVARAITGTRWSGPVFFGLDQLRGAA